MADSLVDSLVSLAIEKLAKVADDEVALLMGVTNEIGRLSRTFILIQAVLKDAETRRVKDEAVKIWLDNVKDVAYDIDDILDEWKIEALRSQAVDEGDGSCFSKKKVRSFHSPVTCFSNVKLHHRIGSRIKEVRGRLHDIAEEKNQLGLRADGGESERVDSELRQGEIREQETGSLLDLPSVVGREGEKNQILELLLQEVIEVPFVISIVGMGGLGKTTLAQLAYNDDKVKGHFDMRMWVCVSEDFDVKRVTESIIKSADTEFKGEKLNLDQLQLHLHEMLRAKQFLLVLDDIWSEESEKWDRLRLPFQAGALGSRIVITTRNENVALVMGRAHLYKLAVLSDEDCWLLFSRRALEHRSAEECSELEDIGRKIIKKCGGLPLAAKTIGSTMCSRRTRSQWELVLRSEIWKSGDFLPALLLSYYDLPPALKQCFAYFSIFPKDWGIEKDMIVKLWVAQGFVRSEGSEDMEEIGGQYFDELLSRSLLQDAVLDDDKNIPRCKMHDLVHDLAQSVVGSNCSVVEIGKQALSNLNNFRHSLLIVSHEAGDETDETNEADEMVSIFSTRHKAQKLRCSLPKYRLRTLIIKSRTEWLRNKVPQNLFQHLRCIRALDLRFADIEKLPKTVGRLKHLRYLDLSCTDIEELPEVVTNCGNLHTLRLNGCYRLRKLPKGIRKMISLRHLELKICDKLKYLPQGIGRLTSLRTLTNFILGVGNEGCKCGELKHLNHLQGILYINGMENVRSTDEASEAELYNKQNLHALFFEYNDDDAELLDDEVKKIEDVLEILQPHTNLKVFTIWFYKGWKLPKWIEDPVFSNLAKVELFYCRQCKQLPGLDKLPSLKFLYIRGMVDVRKVGGEFSGGGGGVSFPKLEILHFQDMPKWEEWELRGGDGEVMPSLLQLKIHGCPKLNELPSNLPPLLHKLILNVSNEGMSSGGPLPILPSLKHLEIMDSDELTSIPCGWLGQLKALQILEIWHCPKLGSLPEELQQLTMFQELRMMDCPLLKERYRDGGEDRDKIAYIPNITFIQ